MFVDKKKLLNKDDQDLERYLVPNSGYVAKSVEYAFEILKSRGRVFSVEEEASIRRIIEDKQMSEEIKIHPLHRTAGFLVDISGFIGLGIFIWKFDELPHPLLNVFPFIALCIIFCMGYLIRKGTDWMKYILLMFVLLGTMGLPIILMNLFENPVLAVANSVQGLLQIIAVILMFRIPDHLRNKD